MDNISDQTLQKQVMIQPTLGINSSETYSLPTTPFERSRRSSIMPLDAIVLNISPKKRSASRSSLFPNYLTAENASLLSHDHIRRKTSFRGSHSDLTITEEDDKMSQEDVIETLKAHKHLITNIKLQNWPMYRKLRIIRRAKLYIKNHEGELKQSKQVVKYGGYLGKTFKTLKREFNNIIVMLTPWEIRIKKIESQFGSVVASYFIFLRWVFWINTFISIFLCVFLMVPEILRDDVDLTRIRKFPDAGKNLTFKEIINTAWNFDGYLKYSPIFYGYYSNEETTSFGYRLPLAYLCSCLFLYMFSFFCILTKITKNAEIDKLSSKEDEYIFSWKLFSGWDFMIGNSETAYNKFASIVMGFKEVILEEKEKKKEEKNWKLIACRLLANILVLLLLASSAYAVVLVVQRSLNLPPNPGFFRENEVTLVVSGIGAIYPNIFSIISLLESHHPRIALRWQLGRILILQLLNLYTLMFSLFGKIDDMTEDLLKYKVMIKVNHTQQYKTYTTQIHTQRGTKSINEINILTNLSDFELRIKRSPNEGRLYPPEDTDDWFTDIRVKPYFKSDLDDVEPIDGRFFIHLTTVTPIVTPELVNWSTINHLTNIKSEILTINKQKNQTNISELTNFNHTQYLNTLQLDNLTTTIQSIIKTNTFFVETTSSSTPMNISTYDESSSSSQSEVSELVVENVTLENFSLTTEDAKRVSCTFQNTTVFTYEPEDILKLTDKDQEYLRELCWETMFGQELVKLTIMDLMITIAQCLVVDYLRAVLVRYCKDCICFFWDLEKKYPGYGDFQIAENILHLVNNQGMVWLGMFFSPGLPAINTIKLCILMYLRSWAVLTSNIPHENVFKASGSNNFYYTLLLLFLFICTLPVGYAMVWIEPSWHCGPFSGHQRMYHVITHYLSSKLPAKVNAVIEFLTSPGTIIPLIVLFILIILYLMSAVSSLREVNSDLKHQLRKEKDEIDQSDESFSEELLSEVLFQQNLNIKRSRTSDEIFDSDKARLLSSVQKRIKESE